MSLVEATGASLTLTNGVHSYNALTNTVVTLAGRCELRLTDSQGPLSGSVIHMNSGDTLLVLPNMLPSVAASSVLPLVRVNGAVAAVGGNVRLVQYANGAAVVPHAPAFQPLTVFSGPYFTDESLALSQHTYYRTNLGSFYAGVRSFKLKRGYQATFAQNENGSGLSLCYTAQDGDLEIALLPPGLAANVRFVYVVPWCWTGKKGIAGNIEAGLNLQWKYNWNISTNSTPDLEYVPIRQTQWWPSLSQNWASRGASHLLGFNEPDKADQANMSVGTAIARWPDLLATGLRVGAPAVSDGGRTSWLYPFIDQADAVGLRVDFVPVHYYWCHDPADPAGAASKMYGFLKATYDEVKRPLWITEWNNGASWTSCGDPTFAQQQAAIAAMIDMLDETPFVERYALYNWVEDVRRLKWEDGTLTDAGITYRDQRSPLAYLQAVPSTGSRSFTQLRFEGNVLDSAGYGNNGVAAGSPVFTNGVSGQAVVFDGVHTVVTLPPNIATGSAFSFAAWVRWGGGGNWQRILDFGNSTTHYMYLTPRSGGGKLRFCLKNGGGEQAVEAAPLTSNQWQHVAVTLNSGQGRIFINGILVSSNTSLTINPSQFSPRVNRLGRSHFAADPLFKGILDEVLITDYALSATQIAAMQTNLPPQFSGPRLVRGPATEGISLGATLTGTATDSNAGDTLTYSKTSGPSWLTVAANGTLGGTPGAGDLGTNLFTVRATDAAGANDFAVLEVAVLNPPPLLPPQADRTHLELTSLRVTNTAIRGTSPLSYLLLDPPTGAAISPDGIITWTPTEAQGPGTHILITRVADSSVPSLSATNSFTVTVLETNHPPSIVPPGNQTRAVGQWLQVTNVATDPDPGPATFDFSLLSAPTGAAIDGGSGVVSWRPTVAAAGKLHWFTVRCADTGVPSLAATQSFAVLVNPLAPVTLVPGALNGSLFSIGLNGEPGPDYTVQSSTNLGPLGVWANLLTTNVVLSPLWMHLHVPTDGAAPRFFRVMVGP